MAAGLFYVYTDPGTVDEAEFHDWYDHEDRPDVIDSPEYQALSANASDRDKSVAAGLAALDRRVYEQVSEDGSSAGRPAPVILAVAMSVPEGSEDDLAAWYTEEHIPMLLEVPGWRRIRRFRLTRALDGPGPDFLSVHELAGPEVLEDPGFRAAISTPWRNRVVASALRRERRVFGLRNAIGG